MNEKLARVILREFMNDNPSVKGVNVYDGFVTILYYDSEVVEFKLKDWDKEFRKQKNYEW